MLSVDRCRVAEVLDSSSGIPADVTFLVYDGDGGFREFKAHKYFLALVSGVFKARFFGSLRDKTDILDVKGTTAKAFIIIIIIIVVLFV